MKKITNVIENVFFVSSILFALLFFCWCIVEIVTDISNWQKIASFAALSTISITIYVFISNNKMKRLEYAIKIVEDFDREDFRNTRNLTRQIGKVHKDGKIAPQTLFKLINNNFADTNDKTKNSNLIDNNDEVEKLKTICNFTDEDCKKLEESVIFTFNYWERVYNAIKYNVANDEFIKEHLSDIYVSQYDRFLFWIKETITSEKMLKTLENFDKESKKFLERK